MHLTVKDELECAFMDLDKEIYKIKKGSSPNTKYITGLLEYIEKLQSEYYAIPCKTFGDCICLDRDWNNGTSCKIYGMAYNPAIGCRYYSNLAYYKECIDGRKRGCNGDAG
jgi:hypothetical protein